MKKGEREEVFTEVQHSSNCDVLGFYLNESSQNPVGVSDPYFLPEEAEAQREELAQDYAANEMQSQSHIWFQARALGTLTFFPTAFVSMTPYRTKGFGGTRLRALNRCTSP